MIARSTPSAAILCGGAGRRLGGADKGRLTMGGRSFIDRQIEVIRPLTRHLMLVDRDGSHAAPPDVQVVADLVPDSGALGGIYTAVTASPAERTLVVACDMPFITADFLTYLLSAEPALDVVIPRDDRGRYPLCGVFHRRTAETIRSLIDARTLRVEDALARLEVRALSSQEIAPFDTAGRLLLNVNTPEEYRRAVSADQQGTTFA